MQGCGQPLASASPLLPLFAVRRGRARPFLPPCHKCGLEVCTLLARHCDTPTFFSPYARRISTMICMNVVLLSILHLFFPLIVCALSRTHALTPLPCRDTIERLYPHVLRRRAVDDIQVRARRRQGHDSLSFPPFLQSPLLRLCVCAHISNS